MPKVAGLTPKEQLFVAEYLRDRNGTRAAIAAGYSVKSADKIACELIRKTRVADVIARKQARLLERAEITAQEIVDGLAILARADISDAAEWDDDGFRLKPSATTDTRPILKISVLRNTSTTKRDGSETTTLTERHSVEIHNKHQALKTLAELTGLMPKGDGAGAAGKDGDTEVKAYTLEDWEAVP